jgi:hypothetical protein
MQYRVRWQEVFERHIVVEAESEDEAIELVDCGDFDETKVDDYGGLEYKGVISVVKL